MGPAETAARARVRRLVHPGNPASVKLADVALRMARLLDDGDTREMLRFELRVAVSQLRDCGPQQSDFLDDLRARRLVRAVEMFEATADAYRDA